MQKINQYTVPNYYKNFQCKGIECRTTCCKGWDVTISMKEYFALQAMNCSKKLRKNLDRSFLILKNPTNERYAKVAKTEENDCPLHMSNGYCMLHFECGEKALPAICRYYPRGPRTDYKFECSCSNSCEKVIELLLKDEEIITFEQMPLSFDLAFSSYKISDDKKELYVKTREICNSILTNREFTLSTRLILLGKVIKFINDKININQTINYDLITIELLLKDFSVVKDIEYTLNIQEKFLTFFKDNSPSIKNYAEQALNYYHLGNQVEQYKKAKKQLKTLFPELEIMFEKIIHNYLYYEQFPFSKQLDSLWDEFESLCGVYLFIKYLTIGYMADKNTLNDFVDVISAAFRLINHTSFNHNIDIMLINENITTLDQLAVLLYS